jgi:hypothetical protein
MANCCSECGVVLTEKWLCIRPYLRPSFLKKWRFNLNEHLRWYVEAPPDDIRDFLKEIQTTARQRDGTTATDDGR